MVTIRRATVQDAPALDRLNVRLLRAAYGGQLPGERLSGRGSGRRAGSAA